MIFKNLFFVFIGGGLGSSLRFLSLYFFLYFFPKFSFLSTLLVNSIGCFLIGFFSVIVLGDIFINYEFFTIGFLGGLTTFSTFINEFFSLIEKNSYIIASMYLFLNLLLGFFLLILGKNTNFFDK